MAANSAGQRPPVLRHSAPDFVFDGDGAAGNLSQEVFTVNVARWQPKLLLVVLLILGLLPLGHARADGWSMSNLFSSKPTTKSKKKAGGKKPPSASQNVMNALSSGPKKLYSNTKSMVMPDKKPAPKSKAAGYNATAKATPPKSTGLMGLFKPAEPPPLPRTIGEWMKQKRVEP